MMPFSVLGAIVLYIGYKLCAPRVWKHIAHIGSEQLFVFTATVLVTVTTDLLWGIAASPTWYTIMYASTAANSWSRRGATCKSVRGAGWAVAGRSRLWQDNTGMRADQGAYADFCGSGIREP